MVPIATTDVQLNAMTGNSLGSNAEELRVLEELCVRCVVSFALFGRELQPNVTQEISLNTYIRLAP